MSRKITTSKLTNAPLLLGVTLVGVPVLLGIVAILYTPHNPSTIIAEAASSPISKTHLLGTDYLGRDTLSRLMAGALISMTIAFTTIIVASMVAFTLSMVSISALHTNTRGGKTVFLSINFLVNTIMGIPSLLLALAVVTLLGGGVPNTMIAITIMLTPGLTRIMQGGVLEVYSEDYIKIAKTWGVGSVAIALRHVLPNAAPTIIVAIPIYMSASILVEAGLSYLGLGVAPPTPSWGLMLNQSMAHINTQPLAAIVPAVAIVITILGLNLISDGLNKALNLNLNLNR